MKLFRLSLRDNDSYAFRGYPSLTEYQRLHQEIVPDMSGAPRAEVRRCTACGQLLNKWDEPLVELVIKKRTLDISITYDGVIIASERFRSVYEAQALRGLSYQALPDDGTFYSVRAIKAVPFDADRRKTRFINQCPSCARYESVVGATPVFLKGDSQLEMGEFVRTDLEFGTADGKHPLLLCDEAAAAALTRAKLKGVDLVAIEEAVSS